MDQSVYPDKIGANRLPPTAYGQSVEKLAPRKYRKTKLTIYILAVLLIGFFVYSNYIKSDPLSLTQPQTASSNQTENPPAGGRDSAKADSYWGQSTTPVPTYPPITATTDLPQAVSDIEIPDFADQITSLKELIAK